MLIDILLGEMADEQSGRAGEWRRSRSAARLAACLALFEMEFAGKGSETVIADFRNNRFCDLLALDEDEDNGAAIDWGALDENLFQDVVRGAVSEQARIDVAIRNNLARGWRYSRIDSTSRAILRAGVYELLDALSTPAKSVIDEYVEIAKSFFDDDTPAFINGVLDSVAKEARAAELVR